MITTEFLPRDQFTQYGHWLKAQDPQTIHDYFGFAITPDAIDALIEKFAKHSSKNRFLIAKKNGFWVGTIHIAIHDHAVEFGIIVGLQNRKQGIANLMMDEALTWARNRFFDNLCMHCIYRNTAIKKLCRKHDLKVVNMLGDLEGSLILEPPTPVTFFKEQLKTSQQNWVKLLRLSHLIA